jgi:hypothetical protein
MGTWLPETINIHEKELCVKLVIYKDYTKMHGQQDIKYFSLFNDSLSISNCIQLQILGCLVGV